MIDPLINSLTQVVISMFNLAGDSRLSSAQQHQLFVTASQLHGMSVSLAAKQFDSTSSDYQSATRAVQTVSAQLSSVNAAIVQAVGVVTNLAALAAAVDSLVKVAASLAL